MMELGYCYELIYYIKYKAFFFEISAQKIGSMKEKTDSTFLSILKINLYSSDSRLLPRATFNYLFKFI
jgi:hypothetical protein